MVRIRIPKREIEDFSSRWKIKELAFFGSVLREDFGPESDIDVLVSFLPDANWSLFDHVDMQEELERIFNRKIDLISRRGIERSRNTIRRQAILASLEPFYVAA